MPAGITLYNWSDRSTLVIASAASVGDAILIDLGLAGLILLAFLLSLPVTLVVTLVVALVVPATLATSVLLPSVHGLTFTIMTLVDIAAPVGLIIDDVITMIEHLACWAGAALDTALLDWLLSSIRALPEQARHAATDAPAWIEAVSAQPLDAAKQDRYWGLIAEAFGT